VRDWIKQEENQFWSTPWEVVKRLPSDILIKAGFAQSSGGSNFIDGRDPKDLLDSLPRMSVKDMLPIENRAK
jgi:hypothetical protein